ncbi:Maltodextrin phosphorylase [uncultured archaeon]|nr:Maltodextrin phosphorylase [uncultured archaeon]
MEVGISHSIPTYAGGLGILAGDTLKSYADLHVPVVGVTLLNKSGYFYQKLDEQGRQSEQPVHWNPEDLLQPSRERVSVQIEGRNVELRAWRLMIHGADGYELPVYFLDSDLEGNSVYDRALTSYLYGGDRTYRLAQEIVLGVGGVRMLAALGYGNLAKYHMNEGHAALLIAELLRKQSQNPDNPSETDLEAVRRQCVFTTHTPVAAGHDVFDSSLFFRLVGNFVPPLLLQKATMGGKVNMTLLGLNGSQFVNGVAKRHGEVTRAMFPDYHIHSITNGIHPPSWASPPFAQLFDTRLPGWRQDPFSLREALSIPKEQIWEAHAKAKGLLTDYINEHANVGFHPARFTLGFARRFTAYKRPDLALYDVERLIQAAEHVGDIQLVFAGKAHPQDGQGKDLIQQVLRAAQEVNGRDVKLRIAFLRNYDMQLSKLMVAGCDVWLNTPQAPREASGTSGMKAALNGVPHFSTLDGWWVEGCIENVTGWSIGGAPVDNNPESELNSEADALDLYDKLEQTIIPTFYGKREQWIDIMRHCIAINASFFNTYRMAHQYIANAYLE